MAKTGGIRVIVQMVDEHELDNPTRRFELRNGSATGPVASFVTLGLMVRQLNRDLQNGEEIMARGNNDGET